MFGFDDDGLSGFDQIDFGEARDPTEFITPDEKTDQPEPQIISKPVTSPTPSLTNPFSPIDVKQSLSPAPSVNPILNTFIPAGFQSAGSTSPISQPTGQSQTTSSYKKSKWTPEEDDMLRSSVNIHGTKNWTAVSTLVPGRNPKQCRERWTAQLDPALTRDDWTPQEDATLLHIHKLHGNAWAKIASFLPGRSSNAVKNRFNWLSRRRFPQTMNVMMAQPNPQMQMQPQMGMGMGMGLGTGFGMGMQAMPMQMQMPVPMKPQVPVTMQYPTQMQMPRYNSLSPAQCSNFGFSDPSFELPPPPRKAQSATGSLTDNITWEDYAPFQTSQSPIDELCGDFDWNMN